VSEILKLSSPATAEFWKIPILFEDRHLLALDKPSGLLVSPDRREPERPNLMQLLHRDLERGADWAKERGLNYLMHTHRIDPSASGVLVLAKDKPTLVAASSAPSNRSEFMPRWCAAHPNNRAWTATPKFPRIRCGRVTCESMPGTANVRAPNSRFVRPLTVSCCWNAVH
jgi:hypothetical protein